MWQNKKLSKPTVKQQQWFLALQKKINYLILIPLIIIVSVALFLPVNDLGSALIVLYFRIFLVGPLALVLLLFASIQLLISVRGDLPNKRKWKFTFLVVLMAASINALVLYSWNANRYISTPPENSPETSRLKDLKFQVYYSDNIPKSYYLKSYYPYSTIEYEHEDVVNESLRSNAVVLTYSTNYKDPALINKTFNVFQFDLSDESPPSECELYKPRVVNKEETCKEVGKVNNLPFYRAGNDKGDYYFTLDNTRIRLNLKHDLSLNEVGDFFEGLKPF